MSDHDQTLLTAVELAEALAVSISTVRRLTRDGLPVIRVRSLVRFDLDEVKAYLGKAG